MSKILEMNNTRVVIKKVGSDFMASVSSSLPSAYVSVCFLESTKEEALQVAFYDFAQELNDRKIWAQNSLPQRYNDDDVVLYDSSCLDYVKYEEQQNGNIVCTIKIGGAVATSATISYQSATYSACKKIVNYFINKL